MLESPTARLHAHGQSGDSLMVWQQRLQLKSYCVARSCGHFAGNVDCVGVIDPRFLRYRICRCIYLRSFLGSISQGRISSAIGRTLELPFVSELSLEHAGYSSAGLLLASLFSPPSSGVPAVPLVSATVPLASCCWRVTPLQQSFHRICTVARVRLENCSLHALIVVSDFWSTSFVISKKSE